MDVIDFLIETEESGFFKIELVVNSYVQKNPKITYYYLHGQGKCIYELCGFGIIHFLPIETSLDELKYELINMYYLEQSNG